ncbi:Striatin family-domain-containing protein [Lipomyces arxii]|uniref:Striatin family-domain-containing protein n=1 Tax=Lipomyces arxii TaxID=56418 RepID=UPI0034CF1EBF
MAGTAGGQQASTEYTLQGVMRFLQTEWQKNEQDRLKWEIEKAEMKSRIARLEGEKRGTDRLVDDLTRRIKMLEKSLIEARHLNGTTESTATAVEDIPSIHQTSMVDVERVRLKSREYLEKCLQEAAFLLAYPQSIPNPTIPPTTDPIPVSTVNGFKEQQRYQPSLAGGSTTSGSDNLSRSSSVSSIPLGEHDSNVPVQSVIGQVIVADEGVEETPGLEESVAAANSAREPI